MENEKELEQSAGPTIFINVNKDDYFKCSMFYMRRYFGLREIIVLTLLLTAGLALFFAMGNAFILILFAISVVLILIVLVLFILTSTGGFKVDMEKKGIVKQKLEFNEDALVVTNIDYNGNPVFIETHPYDRIEKISVGKKRIYIYAQVSVFYYIWAKNYEPEVCEQISSFLKKTLPAEKFKIRKRYRGLPKKKKLTLEEDE